MEIQQHLLAIILFIRDEENIIYMGIIMVIISLILCFINISRSHGNPTINEESK